MLVFQFIKLAYQDSLSAPRTQMCSLYFHIKEHMSSSQKRKWRYQPDFNDSSDNLTCAQWQLEARVPYYQTDTAVISLSRVQITTEQQVLRFSRALQYRSLPTELCFHSLLPVGPPTFCIASYRQKRLNRKKMCLPPVCLYQWIKVYVFNMNVINKL